MNNITIIQHATNIGPTVYTYGKIDITCDDYHIKDKFFIAKNADVIYYNPSKEKCGNIKVKEYYRDISNIQEIQVN